MTVACSTATPSRQGSQALASTTVNGSLTTAVYHSVPAATFASSETELGQMATYAAANAPSYTFTNTRSDFVFEGNDSGGSGAPTATFLGGDASGAAASDTADVGDTIVDSKGFFTATTAGTYAFHLGNTDDASAIFIDGDGTSGSGTAVVTNSYTRGAAADATVQLAAGASIAVEILYGNGYGGAGLDGVTIVDPNGQQVTYTTTSSGSSGGSAPDAGGTTSPPAAPTSGSGPATGTYLLENVEYSQALAVSQAQSFDGNVLVTYSVNRGAGQQFAVVPASGGGYQLEEQIGGRCLDVSGTQVTITTCSGASTQSFALALQGDGAYTITASDGACVEALGDYDLVDAGTCSGDASQDWYFSSTSSGAGGGSGGGTTTDAGSGSGSGTTTDAGSGSGGGGSTGGGAPVGALGQSFKLMTLGDSMTAGYGAPDIGGYRGPLYQSLVAEGYSPQMVGASNCGAVSLLPTDQQNCDGVGGATIEATLGRVTAGGGLVKTEDPDVILLLIGFNTLYYEANSVATDLGLLSTLVDDIVAQKPTARLVVASLIASTQCCGTDLIVQYNAGVPGIVAAKKAQGYPVSFVDLYPVVPPNDLYDYVHPNDAGYPLVANAWLGAINAIAKGE